MKISAYKQSQGLWIHIPLEVSHLTMVALKIFDVLIQVAPVGALKKKEKTLVCSMNFLLNKTVWEVGET